MQNQDADRLKQDIQAVFDELDWKQLAIFARHTPTRRLEMMFDLCNFAHNMVVASERQRNPNITDSELAQRIRDRIRLSHAH